jgi:post-segregation antitoxin (ccd killing protein)
MEYSIVYSARLAAASSIAVGDVLILESGNDDQYVKATTANRGSRRSHGLALTAWASSTVGAVQMQQTGYASASVTGLTAGSASWVRCSSTGRLERFTPSTAGASDVVGYADALGGVALSFGFLTEDMVVGASSVHAGTCTLEQFGAVGDGTTDDSAAMTAALAALSAGTYNTLRLGAKTYLVGSGFDLPSGCAIIGEGNSSSVLKTTSNSYVLRCNGVNDITLLDFTILGNSTGASQHGLYAGVDGDTDSGPSRLYVAGVVAANLGGRGFSYVGNVGLATSYEGPRFVGLLARGCGYGYYFAERGEYATMVGCAAESCTIRGVTINAGNVSMLGGNITNCNLNMYLGPGTNDGHGIISGVQINHAARLLEAGDIANGFPIIGCNMYAGQIWLENSDAVRFIGGAIDATSFVFKGSTGTLFQDVLLPYTQTNVVFDDYLGNASSTRWVNCHKLDGTVPDFVAERVQFSFTFASDANDTLTANESQAETIIIADGVISATRSLTINLAPAGAKSRRWRVRNENAQAVTVKFTSGTGVTLAGSGAGAVLAWIGSDGTNAIEV